MLGRNGGDEFCILLPDCTFEEDRRTAESLHKPAKNLLI